MAKANITIEGKSYNTFPQFIQNDYGFDIYFYIKNNDNSVFDLTDYSASFKSREQGETVTQFDSACSINNYTTGEVIYTVNENDLNEVGTFDTQLQFSSPNTIITIDTGEMIVQEEI